MALSALSHCTSSAPLPRSFTINQSPGALFCKSHRPFIPNITFSLASYSSSGPNFGILQSEETVAHKIPLDKVKVPLPQTFLYKTDISRLVNISFFLHDGYKMLYLQYSISPVLCLLLYPCWTLSLGYSKS